MVALKIFDVLVQASHVYTVHNTVISLLKGQHACNYTVAATWTPLFFIQRHINYNNIYYNQCTNRWHSFHWCTVSCLQSVSSSLKWIKCYGGSTLLLQTFTVASCALRCKPNLHVYNCYELGDLLSRANIICFKQETGTLHYNNVYSPYQGPPKLFGCSYSSVQLYISSAS